MNRNCGEGCTARLSANILVLVDARGTTKYPMGVAQRKENNSRDDGSGLSIQGHSGVSEFRAPLIGSLNVGFGKVSQAQAPSPP